MSRLTKIMLGLTIVNTVASALVLTGIVNLPRLDVVFPLTAIFFGMFLICRVLEKDVAEFDAEERRHHEHAARENHGQSVDFIHGHGHHEPTNA